MLFETISLTRQHHSFLFLLAQLSSKDDYGYFFRTIPTELMFGRVMMEFVASRGWKKVAVFYTGDELGSQSKQPLPLTSTLCNLAYCSLHKNFKPPGKLLDVEAGTNACSSFSFPYKKVMDSIALQARKRNITIGQRKPFWEMESGSDIGPGLDALKASGEQIVLVAAVGEPQIRLMTEAV